MSLGPAIGHVLVASPGLLDPNFFRTVVLLCRYDAQRGAVGLVLNRPTEVTIGKVLPQLADGRDEPLWVGGPVDARSLCGAQARRLAVAR
jgi:putative transcriptional regulator